MRVPAQKVRLQSPASRSSSPGKRTSRSLSPSRVVRKTRLQSSESSARGSIKHKPGSRPRIARSTSVPLLAKSTGKQENISRKGGNLDSERAPFLNRVKGKLEKKAKTSPSRLQVPKREAESKKQESSCDEERRLRSRSRSMERDNKRNPEDASEGPKSKKSKKSIVSTKHAGGTKVKFEGNEGQQLDFRNKGKRIVKDKMTENKATVSKQKKKNVIENQEVRIKKSTNESSKETGSVTEGQESSPASSAVPIKTSKLEISQSENTNDSSKSSKSKDVGNTKGTVKAKNTSKKSSPEKECVDIKEETIDRKTKSMKQSSEKETSTILSKTATTKSGNEKNVMEYVKEESVGVKDKNKSGKKSDKSRLSTKQTKPKGNITKTKGSQSNSALKKCGSTDSQTFDECQKKKQQKVGISKKESNTQKSVTMSKVLSSTTTNDDSSNSDEITLDKLLGWKENKQKKKRVSGTTADNENLERPCNIIHPVQNVCSPKQSSLNSDSISNLKKQKICSELSPVGSKSPTTHQKDYEKSVLGRVPLNSSKQVSAKKEQGSSSSESEKCSSKLFPTSTLAAKKELQDSECSSNMSLTCNSSKKEHTNSRERTMNKSTSISIKQERESPERSASCKPSVNIKSEHQDIPGCRSKSCTPSSSSNFKKDKLANLEDSCTLNSKSVSVSKTSSSNAQTVTKPIPDLIPVPKKNKFLRFREDSFRSSSPFSRLSPKKERVSSPENASPKNKSPLSSALANIKNESRSPDVLAIDFQSTSSPSVSAGSEEIQVEKIFNKSAKITELAKVSATAGTIKDIKLEKKDASDDESENTASSRTDRDLTDDEDEQYINIPYDPNKVSCPRLYAMWNAPKKQRIASLNAMAKVHVLYENESRIIQPSPRYKTYVKSPPKTKIKKEPKSEESDSAEKSKEEDENISTRVLRSVPGLRGAGRNWDILAALSTSSSSLSSDNESDEDSRVPLNKRTPRPPPKQRAKMEAKLKRQRKEEKAAEKEIRKRKRRNQCELMDLKDMVVQKRMASLNASAILAASYSSEKRMPRTPRYEPLSDTDSSPVSVEEVMPRPRESIVLTGDSNDEDEEPYRGDKRKRRRKRRKRILSKKHIEDASDSSSDRGLDRSPRRLADLRPRSPGNKEKMSVILDRDGDIKEVYVNSTRSTYHEGYYSVDGKHFKFSSTSRTQTEAKAVAADASQHGGTSSERSPSSAAETKSYTPLGALSSMQPPGVPPPPHHYHHHHHHHPPQYPPPPPPGCQQVAPIPLRPIGPPLSPTGRPHAYSAFSAPHNTAYVASQQPPPAPHESGSYVHGGYYQPAGPLISAHHHLHTSSTTVTATSKVTTASVLPTPETSATPTPPPSSTSQSVPPTQGLSSASTPSITTTRGGDESPTDDIAPTCSSAGEIVVQPTPPSSSYRYQSAYPTHTPPHQSYPYGYTQYYPSPPASANIQYPPPPNPPAAHHYHSTQEPCYTGTYPPPPPHIQPYFHPKTYSSSPPTATTGYYRRYVSSQYYAVDPYGPAHPPPTQSGSPGPASQQNQQMVVRESAPPRDIQPPSSTLMEPYPPAPPTSVPAVINAYPPPPPGYFTSYPPPAAPCYSHPPPSRLAFIDAPYAECPCPMSQCPKNVHTGPLTGDGKGPQKHLPLAISLPDPCSELCPSPARGSAGISISQSLSSAETGNSQDSTDAVTLQHQPPVQSVPIVKAVPPTKMSSTATQVTPDSIRRDSLNHGLLKISHPQNHSINALISEGNLKKHKDLTLNGNVNVSQNVPLLMCTTNFDNQQKQYTTDIKPFHNFKEYQPNSFHSLNTVQSFPTPVAEKLETKEILPPILEQEFSGEAMEKRESALVSEVEHMLAQTQKESDIESKVQKRKEAPDADLNSQSNHQQPRKKPKVSIMNGFLNQVKEPKHSFFDIPQENSNIMRVNNVAESFNGSFLNTHTVQNSQMVQDVQEKNTPIPDFTEVIATIKKEVISDTEASSDKSVLEEESSLRHDVVEQKIPVEKSVPFINEAVQQFDVPSKKLVIDTSDSIMGNGFAPASETEVVKNDPSEKENDFLTSEKENNVSNVRKRPQTLLSSLKSSKKIKLDTLTNGPAFECQSYDYKTKPQDETNKTEDQNQFRLYKLKPPRNNLKVMKDKCETSNSTNNIDTLRSGKIDSGKLLNDSSNIACNNMLDSHERSLRNSIAKTLPDNDTETTHFMNGTFCPPGKRKAAEPKKNKKEVLKSKNKRSRGSRYRSETLTAEECLQFRTEGIFNGAKEGDPKTCEMRKVLQILKPAPKPKWSNGWSWEGRSCIGTIISNECRTEYRKCYRSIRHEQGDVISAFDCVLLKAGRKKNDVPFVAKVGALWENPDNGEMMLSILWYYRAQHTEQSELIDSTHEDEIFASKHKDCSSVACIEDKCYVLTYSEYCRYKKMVRAVEQGVTIQSIVPECKDYYRRHRQPPIKTDPNSVFFSTKVYDARAKKMLKTLP